MVDGMAPIRSLLLLPSLLALAGCFGGQGRNVLLDHVNTDFATQKDADHLYTLRVLNAAVGYDLPRDRPWGPQKVVPLADGAAVLIATLQTSESVQRPPAPLITVLKFTALDARGQQLFDQSATLGAGYTVASLAAAEHPGLGPAIRVQLTPPAEAAQPVTSLVWAFRPVGPYLVRCEYANGQLADPQLSRHHPALLAGGGDLTATDPALQLAALVALAQPARAKDRQEPGINSHLKALANGSDLWLAAAAAGVLTQ